MATGDQTANFRCDINALRALAVVLVLLFHFDVAGFSAGFVGVDVFFVLSGYLMTAIILGSLERGSFSLLGFYSARARRIVPALTAVVVTLLAFGWFWLSAHSYQSMSMESVTALLFASNVHYANEVAYFATEAHGKWLLHTWSLSVEWQFYLVFPILLLALRAAKISVHLAIAGLAVASALTALYLSHTDPIGAFYQLPPRAWELLTGALVFSLQDRAAATQRMWVTLLGVLLIVASATDIMPLPQTWRVLPAVVGTALVLISRPGSSFVTRNPIVMAVGLWSYSIYLWHWPLMVGALYFGYTLQPAVVAVLFVSSVALGALSYHWVEQPFRERKSGAPSLPKTLSGPWIAAVLAALAIGTTEGAIARHPDHLANIAREAFGSTRAEGCGWNKRTKSLQPCHLGTTGSEVKVAVWGDSHAAAMAPAFGRALATRAEAGALLFRNGCRPLQNLISDKRGKLKDCVLYNREVLKFIESNPQIATVVLVASWSYDFGAGKAKEEDVLTSFGDQPLASAAARNAQYALQMQENFCALKRMGKRVIVTTPLPFFGLDVPETMAKAVIFTGTASVPEISKQVHLKRNGDALRAMSEAGRSCGVEVLDLSKLFCDETTCRGASDGRPLYFDDNHPSAYATEQMTPLVAGSLYGPDERVQRLVPLD